jgi:metal-responsive CopG/Arc/MetJ family transcriptional regulator
MYDRREEAERMGLRKLITISVPPPLLKRAEQVVREENRTKSELLREALRFYVDTREIRRAAMRERAGALISEIQARTKGVPPKEVRKVVREAVEAARRRRRRATA